MGCGVVVAYSLKLKNVIDEKSNLSEGTWISEIQFSSMSQTCLQFTACMYQIKNTAIIQNANTGMKLHRKNDSPKLRDQWNNLTVR